jgi:hypothetical protein
VVVAREGRWAVLSVSDDSDDDVVIRFFLSTVFALVLARLSIGATRIIIRYHAVIVMCNGFS